MNEVTYKFEDHILIVEYPPAGTVHNIRQALATAFSNPAFVQGMKVLIDDRHSSEFPNAEEMVKRVGQLINLRYEIGQECAVVVSKAEKYNIVQTISCSVSKHGFYLRAFYDFREARDWLRSLVLYEQGQ